MSDARDARPQVVRHAKGKRPQFNDAVGADQVLSMVLVLASEMCVLRDRIDAIERVAATKGLDLAAEIDALPLDQVALTAREQRRQDLFQRLYYLMRKEAQELTEADTAERYRSVIDDIAKP